MTSALVALAALPISTAGAASAATAQQPSAGLPTTATDGTKLPDSVVALIKKDQASGATILGVTHASYSPTKSSAATIGGAGSLATSAARLPGGCGLFVYVFKTGSSMGNHSLTACAVPMTYVDMNLGLARNRWYGPQELVDKDVHDSLVKSLGATASTYCAGEGTYDYQGITAGEIEYLGEDYHAEAYDTALKVTC